MKKKPEKVQGDLRVEYSLDAAEALQTILQLSMYEFPQVFPENYRHITKITSLTLSNTLLEILSESIRDLTGLEELIVLDNKFRTLPTSISSLKFLKKLDVTRNQITHLPGNIGECVSLVEILAADNLLTGLPESINMLRNLRRIDFKRNPIKETDGLKISNQIQQVKSLINFELDGTDFLPQTTAAVTRALLKNRQTNVEFLQGIGKQLDIKFPALYTEKESAVLAHYIDNNYFEPYAIDNIFEITKLSLTKLGIEAVSPKICDYVNLTSLNLSDNRISEFPSSITRLTKLIFLDVSIIPWYQAPLILLLTFYPKLAWKP